MPSRLALVNSVFAVLAIALMFVPGCSGDGCDDGDCGADGACVDDGTGARCHRACEGPGACPVNFHCAPTPKNRGGYCVPDVVAYVPNDAAESPWGKSCSPGAGFDDNPACNVDAGFACQAERPTDANAYCTQFYCATDDDCGGGYYCEHINNAPNTDTAKRSFGSERTLTACLKRSYCAPCRGDAECEAIDGVRALCVAGDDGNKFCTKSCDGDSACRADAACVAVEGTAGTVCKPRAGVCRGDGSFCSPCLSDFDCPNGVCITAPYSSEKFCTVTSTTACSPSGGSTCPRQVPGTDVLGVGCATENSNEFPKDTCVPIITFLEDVDGSPLESYGCRAKRPN